MKPGLVVLVLILALLPGCAYILGGTVDYVFAVTGTVTAPDGQPVQGCEVTLEVGGTVYEAVAPIRRQARATNVHGGFQFTYITHRREMPYQLRFEKTGYVVHTIVGASPPPSVHNVTLQAVAVQGSSDNTGGPGPEEARCRRTSGCS